MTRAHEFLAAVQRSQHLHGSWVAPPQTHEELGAYMRRMNDTTSIGYLVTTSNGELAGVIRITGIIRAAFQSGYLGYYAFVPHAGQGIMQDALRQVVTAAFRSQGLHRLEANIQPENLASKAFVTRLGFAPEGFSPRYLKIAGHWRDHERWAITSESWRPDSSGEPG